MDHYRWALSLICIVSDFKSLIAFLVWKLLGSEVGFVLDACFSEEGRKTSRANTAGCLFTLIVIIQTEAYRILCL